MTTMTKQYTQFLPVTSPRANYKAFLTYHQAELIHYLFVVCQKRHLYKCTFSKSLTYSKTNLKELCNWGINVHAPFKLLQIKTGFAWNPQPLRHSVQRELFKCKTVFVPLTLQRIFQGETEHDTVFRKLLTINFKNSYFHNSVDQSGLYLQM